MGDTASYRVTRCLPAAQRLRLPSRTLRPGEVLSFRKMSQVELDPRGFGPRRFTPGPSDLGGGVGWHPKSLPGCSLGHPKLCPTRGPHAPVRGSLLHGPDLQAFC